MIILLIYNKLLFYFNNFLCVRPLQFLPSSHTQLRMEQSAFYITSQRLSLSPFQTQTNQVLKKLHISQRQIDWPIPLLISIMCSQRTMENYQGDLTDILRASGTQTAAEAAATAALQDWQFPSNHPFIYPADPGDDFGDPFSHHLRDPLLHGTIDNAPTGFFHSSDISIKSIGADEMKRPNNMFSRMLQIAPNAKLPLPPSPSLCDSPAAVLTNDHALISPSSAKGCLMESSAAAAALQISSPRNTGIRRRWVFLLSLFLVITIINKSNFFLKLIKKRV